MKITMRHVREVGYCSKGARLFAEKNNLDWKKFLSEGIEDTELLNTGDALAIYIVEKVNGKRQ